MSKPLMPFKDCSALLGKMYGRNHCLLTANGTAALWLAVSVLPDEKPKVVIPALSCPNLVYAVEMAGREVVLADVLESDATMDPEYVDRLLSSDAGIGAVVSVHLYGNPADTSRLEEVTSRHGVSLIDDAAQSMGGHDEKGNPLGSAGDFSILSFGHTKILDAGGGGALLIDDDRLAEKAGTFLGQLPDPRIDVEAYFSIYRSLYYSIYGAARLDPSFFELFENFSRLFKDMFLYRVESQTVTNIMKRLAEKDAEFGHRKVIADLYRKALEGVPSVRLLETRGDPVPWRFSFRVNSKVRNRLADFIRSEGYDASSWYPLLTPFAKSEVGSRSRYPVASKIESEIINLWVTSDYSTGKATKLAKKIGLFLSETRET